MKQLDLFDFSPWRESLGSKFGRFEELAGTLLRLFRHSAKNMLETGKVAKLLIEEIGIGVWDAFRSAKNIPQRWVDRCIALYEKFGSIDIPDGVSLRVLETMVAIPSQSPEWQVALQYLKDGDLERLDELLKPRKPPVRPNEETLRAAVMQLLKDAGYTCTADEYFTHGIYADVVARGKADTGVIECKPILRRRQIFPQALGQVEEAKWNLPKDTWRGLAYFDAEEGMDDLLLMAQNNGWQLFHVERKGPLC